MEVSHLRATSELAEAAQKAEELRQAELKSSAAAAEAAVNQRLLEAQKQLESSRAQENRWAQRLQESQDRLREAQAQVEQLRSDLERLQSQLEKEQMEKAQAQAEGKVDAEDLRKALEKLEAEGAAGEKADRARTHERHELPKTVEKQLPSLSENFGSQEAREATSFLSDEKLLTDQSQQTDPGEQLEEPQPNPLEQELLMQYVQFGSWVTRRQLFSKCVLKKSHTIHSSSSASPNSGSSHCFPPPVVQELHPSHRKILEDLPTFSTAGASPATWRQHPAAADHRGSAGRATPGH